MCSERRAELLETYTAIVAAQVVLALTERTSTIDDAKRAAETAMRLLDEELLTLAELEYRTAVR